MAKKPFFSDEDVKRAMNTDTVAFLEQYYGYSFKKVGQDYRSKEHNSLVVRSDRKRWYWNSRNVGGDSIVAFLQKIERLSFYEAIKAVVNEPMLPLRPITQAEKKPMVPKKIILPTATKTKYSRAYAYLTKTRGIDPTIITYLMRSKRLYQEEATGNAVFVNYKENGEASFFTKQGTNPEKRFKGNADLGNDDKNPVTYYFENYGFWQEGYVQTRVYVFESPIDLLSHATIANMYKGKNTYWLQHSRVALCGVTDLALEHFLEKHPNVKEIRFGLDNDEAGKKATAKYMEKYQKRGYSVKDVSPQQQGFDGKDWNDFLKFRENQEGQSTLNRIEQRRDNR